MIEQRFGTSSVSKRIHSVSAELNRHMPLYDPDGMDGLPREEMMKRLMDEKARLEERLRIVGQAFPNVIGDVNRYVELTYKAMKTMPFGRLPILQEIWGISESYRSGRNREFQAMFAVGLNDRMTLEKISW